MLTNLTHDMCTNTLLQSFAYQAMGFVLDFAYSLQLRMEATLNNFTKRICPKASLYEVLKENKVKQKTGLCNTKYKYKYICIVSSFNVNMLNVALLEFYCLIRICFSKL